MADLEGAWLKQLHEVHRHGGHTYVGPIKIEAILSRGALPSWEGVKARIEAKRPSALIAYEMATSGWSQQYIGELLRVTARTVRNMLDFCESEGLPSWRFSRYAAQEEVARPEHLLTADEMRVTGYVKTGHTIDTMAELLDWDEDRVRTTLFSAATKPEYLRVIEGPASFDGPRCARCERCHPRTEEGCPEFANG